MSEFLQFPKQQYFRALESDTTTSLGYFILQDSTEIKHVMLTIFVRGLIASPFDIRFKIYGSDEAETAIITSEWAELSVASLGNYTQNYIGNIYLDFAGESLNMSNTYYMRVETDGYTRVGDSFYLGINLDWYNPVNTQLTPNEAGARVRILGKR